MRLHKIGTKKKRLFGLKEKDSIKAIKLLLYRTNKNSICVRATGKDTVLDSISVGSNRKIQTQYSIFWNLEYDATKNYTNPHMSLSISTS